MAARAYVVIGPTEYGAIAALIVIVQGSFRLIENVLLKRRNGLGDGGFTDIKTAMVQVVYEIRKMNEKLLISAEVQRAERERWADFMKKMDKHFDSFECLRIANASRRGTEER